MAPDEPSPLLIASLLDEFDQDCKLSSLPRVILMGPPYEELAAIGQTLVPHLLERIQDYGASVSCRVLLESLTGEQQGSWLEPSRIAGEKWIAWGLSRGLIEERPSNWDQSAFSTVLDVPDVCYLCRKKPLITESIKSEVQYLSTASCEDCGVLRERKRFRDEDGTWGPLLEKRVWRGESEFSARDYR